MCGIVGIVTKDGASSPDEGLIRRMAASVAHRGPDGEGHWTGPGVGFGHRRLAIVDLTDTGIQPMHTPDGRFTIVFNGEIYNFRELRAELAAAGTPFHSMSDTEVILEAYRRWEQACVERLRGMFAFAIWDNETKTLFFARDRIGKKPFFYRTLKDGSFAFASEMKALLPLEQTDIDEGAVRLFVGLQYVPSPRTGFVGINSLLPGHRGAVHHGSIHIEPYHDWERLRVRDVPAHPDEAIRTRLEDAVRTRLLADVPVGAFLSGGVDSAAVVALASRHVDHPLRTFTMGFPQVGMDERAEAHAIADKFKTDHMEFEATPEDLTRMSERVVGQYDAPYADSSALPLMLLAEQTAEEIKVVLTGDGGDETFGGYRRYTAFERALRIGAVPGMTSLAPPVMRLLSALLKDPRFERMAETTEWAGKDAHRAYAELFCGSYFSTRHAAHVLSSEFLEGTQQDDAAMFMTQRIASATLPTSKSRLLDPLSRAIFFDLTSYLPDDLNVKMDHATMAFGLEARAPFLDQDVVALALGLPLKERVNHGKTKVALRRALRGVVPEAVLRAKKRGFQVPLGAWFRGSLSVYWRDRCLDPRGPLARYVRLEAAEALFQENERGTDHGNRLWMLLSLSLWLNAHTPST